MDEEHFEQFATLITGLYRNIQKLKSRYVKDLGLKSVHVFWLYLLKQHPEGLYASELAKEGGSTRTLVSREINELLDRGLIVTNKQTNKRRYGWKFVLTAEGKVLAEKIAAIAAEIQAQVDQDISQEELIAMYQTLQTLQDNFDRLVAKTK